MCASMLGHDRRATRLGAGPLAAQRGPHALHAVFIACSQRLSLLTLDTGRCLLLLAKPSEAAVPSSPGRQTVLLNKQLLLGFIFELHTDL